MIHTPVQERPVVRHQDEALLAVQVTAHDFPAPHIQMIGGLVDQQEMMLPGEQCGQQHLGLLPAGKGGKGAGENIVRHVQQGDFFQKPPHLAFRVHVRRDLQRRLAGVWNSKGKIIKLHRGVHRAVIGQLSAENFEQGRFAPAVAGDEAQLPVRIHGEGSVVKNQIGAALISKR